MVYIEFLDSQSIVLTLLHPVTKSKCRFDDCGFSSNNLIGTRTAKHAFKGFFEKQILEFTRICTDVLS